MSIRSTIAIAGAFVLIAGVFLLHAFSSAPQAAQHDVSASTSTQTASVATAVSAQATSSAAATSEKNPATSTAPLANSQNKPQQSQITATATATPQNEIVRIQDPYPTPPESVDAVNDSARAALVNILCIPDNDNIHAISGSGVIIDPRGIILTNAHVAQYVLLSESEQVELSCTVRTGAPAQSAWKAEVLYIPPVWVAAHANEINEDHATGTGEHDYALLRITASANSTPLPASFPSLPIDTRNGIGFLGDSVLVASYPAEFLGSSAAEYDLYPDSSQTNIGQLLTFGTSTVDLISLGGIIEAQSGSSGGAVVNPWGRLIGIVTTTSEGTTTEDRDLRAITLGYINNDLTAQAGLSLTTLLSGDPDIEAQQFTATEAPALIAEFIPYLAQPSQ